jgi:dTDP-4-amino-4,6-dideoxygalactose transaminase
MYKIQMVNLLDQYTAIKETIDENIQKVISETSFIKGPAVKEFEQGLTEYTGSQHTITCANGTDALQIALMALDLKPGDEVITPNFTYIATAEVVKLLGLELVVVDVDEETFNIDVSELEQAITEKTRAVVIVHLFGQCANIEAITQVSKKHNLFLIEDTAQAIGSSYTFSDGTVRQAGTIGDFGTTSFFPSKNLGCYGDGGAIFAQDSQLAERVKMVANHGQSEKYIHDIVGCNSRLDSIQAAVLNAKLPKLPRYIDSRREVANAYDESFKGIEGLRTPKRDHKSTHVFHQYTLKLSSETSRGQLKEHLANLDIPSMVYYPIPLHKQKAFASERLNSREYPITEKLCKTVLSLPIHTEMKQEELEYIINGVLTFFK